MAQASQTKGVYDCLLVVNIIAYSRNLYITLTKSFIRLDHAIYRSIKTTEVKKGVQVTENDKRSSLLRYRVNQGHNF
jgi:hypothetical protein